MERIWGKNLKKLKKQNESNYNSLEWSNETEKKKCDKMKYRI